MKTIFFLPPQSVLDNIQLEKTEMIFDFFSDEPSLFSLFRKYAKKGVLTNTTVIVDATKNSYDEIINFITNIEPIAKMSFKNNWDSFVKGVCILLPIDLNIRLFNNLGINTYNNPDQIEDFLSVRGLF